MKKKNIIFLCAGVVLLLGAGSWFTIKQLQYSHAEKYMKSIGINPDSFSKEEIVSFYDEISSKNELSDSTKDILEKESSTILDNLADSSKKTISELIEAGAFDSLQFVKKIPPGEARKIIPHLSDDQVGKLIDQLNDNSDNESITGTVMSINNSTLTVSCPDDALFQTIDITVPPLCKIAFSDHTTASFSDILVNDQIQFTVTAISVNDPSTNTISRFKGTATSIKINP
ncbi:MAG: hypothetical protein KA953_02085 [Lachnospiraceae bacterium]|nr:hypothetical protein [Lachnospiraceae bacterium]